MDYLAGNVQLVIAIFDTNLYTYFLCFKVYINLDDCTWTYYCCIRGHSS